MLTASSGLRKNVYPSKFFSNIHIYNVINVILYSFGINSSITYLTKHLNSGNSRIFDISKSLYIFPTSSNTLVMIKK